MATNLDLNAPTQLHLVDNPASMASKWEAWRDNMEMYFLATGIDCPKRQKALLLYLAGEDLRATHATLNDTGESYTVTRALLDKHFLPKKNLTFERSQFRAAQQKSDESSLSFITRLRQLAKSCEFSNYSPESAIIDQFIEKTSSHPLRRQLLRQEKLTLPSLIEISQSLELSQMQASQMEGGVTIKQESSEEIQQISTKFTRSTSLHCYGCGSNSHLHKAQVCPARGKICHNCGKQDHFSSVCKQPKHAKPNHVKRLNKIDTNQVFDEEFLFSMTENSTLSSVSVDVDGVPIDFVVDSGASCNVVDRTTWDYLKENNSRFQLSAGHTNIYSYGSSKPIALLGVFYCVLTHGAQRETTRIFVTDNKNAGCLLGRKSCESLQILKINKVYALAMSKIPEKFKTTHQSVFQGLGHFKGRKIKLQINESIEPKVQPLRRIPFHVRHQIDAEIDKLLSLDVIEPASGATTWVSPVVPVPKKNGEIRLCVDLRAVNSAIKRRQYPIPTVDEILEKLNNGKTFSKLDLNMGYHQIELDEESRHLTTFSTTKGLFRYKRLVFGISSAYEEFQEIISSLFKKESNIQNIADDIIVWGANEQEHNTALERCLNILQQNGLTVNPDKCEFHLKEIEYFGFKINGSGIKPSESKIETLKSFQRPTNVSELRSFLGLLTYLGRFIPNLASLTEDLRQLTHANCRWAWTDKHQKAFDQLKCSLQKETQLSHFNIRLPCNVIVDAGPYGIGAILLQDDNHNLNPIAFASRSLTSTERNYSQTEREALAVVWACEKFHLYLFGRQFKIFTDHKPLLQIYSQKGSPSPRILRWSLRLLAYDFTLHYLKGKDNPSDILSRLPQHKLTTLPGDDSAEMLINYTIANAIPKAISLSELLEACKSDEDTQALIESIRTSNWENARVKPYQQLRFELSEKSGLVLRGTRIIIPLSLRSRVLSIVHEGHLGIRKTKELLRTKVWWPRIDYDVEDKVSSCITCTRLQEKQTKEPLQMTEMPDRWHTLHIDVCGPLPSGEYLFGVVDSGSRWPEIFVLKSTKVESIISSLIYLFSNFGVPNTIVSDNGPQFTSETFSSFCNEWGVRHRRVTPYHPQANSEIERLFKTVLKPIKAAVAEGKHWPTEMRKFLLNYRNTPHCSTNKSPASLLLSNPIRDKISPLPSAMSSNYKDAQKQDKKSKAIVKKYADRRVNPSTIAVGDKVVLSQNKINKFSMNYGSKYYTVIKRKGCSIWIEDEEGKTFMRHVSAVRKVTPPESDREEDQSNQTQEEIAETHLNNKNLKPKSPSKPNDNRQSSDRNVFDLIETLIPQPKLVENPSPLVEETLPPLDNEPRSRDKRTTFGVPPTRYQP